MLVSSPPEIKNLFHPLLQKKSLELAVLRLENINPHASGNKFYKLYYNLIAAKNQGFKTVLTFGGAYSNHIFATAASAKNEGIESIGIIRGDFLDENNPTLNFAKSQGMKIHFVDRETYRKKSSPEFLQDLKEMFGEFYLIPEGGTNKLAIEGTKEILGPHSSCYSHIVTPIGTGGTFAGLATGIHQNQSLLGISSLKGDFVHQEMKSLIQNFQISPKGKWEVFSDYHFGGYAKWKPELIEFIWWFFEEFGLILDPVYTGKMTFAIWDLIEKNYFSPESKILLIHTGGLQGNIGFTQRTGIALPTL